MASRSVSESSYQLHHDDMGIDYAEDEINNLLSQWKWLDYLVAYNFMYVPVLPNGKRRHVLCTYMILLITAICPFYQFSQNIYYLSKESDWLHANELILSSLHFISKLCSLYHFFVHFNYPWHHALDCSINLNIGTYSSPYYKLYNKLSIFILLLELAWFICSIMYQIMFWGSESFYFFKGNGANLLHAITLGIFYYFPIHIANAVHIAQCLQYHQYLHQLTNILQYKNEDINASVIVVQNNQKDYTIGGILETYRCIYQSFTKTYHYSLKYSLELFLITEALWIWNYSYFWFVKDSEREDGSYIYKDGTPAPIVYIAVSLIILSFVLPASFLGEQYDTFKDCAWKYGILCLKKKKEGDDQVDMDYYHYFLQFVQEHPINIHFMGDVVVTKVNLIRFMLLFVVARYVSYSLAYFSV